MDAIVIEMYKQGKMQEEIAEHFGISRWRVRVILKRNHIGEKDGGRAVRGFLNLSSRIIQARETTERQEKRCREMWGISLEERKVIIKRYGVARGEKSPFSKYGKQRWHAARRGIEWNISFREWWRIWQASGKWEQRGCWSQDYVMARIGDSGAYEVGNVYITTVIDNHSMVHIGRDLPTGVSHYGKKYRARRAVNGKDVYLGIFDSIESAQRAYSNLAPTPEPMPMVAT